MIIIFDSSPFLAGTWQYLFAKNECRIFPVSPVWQTSAESMNEAVRLKGKVSLLLFNANCRFRDGVPGARLFTEFLLASSWKQAGKIVYGLDARETLIACGWQKIFEGEPLGLFHYLHLPNSRNLPSALIYESAWKTKNRGGVL